MARLARLAASAGGSEASQRAAVIRCPLKPAESSETSQRMSEPFHAEALRAIEGVKPYRVGR